MGHAYKKFRGYYGRGGAGPADQGYGEGEGPGVKRERMEGGRRHGLAIQRRNRQKTATASR